MKQRGQPIKCTPEKREAFLRGLREAHTAKESAEAVGLCRQVFFDWKNKDPGFAEEWEKAYQEGTEVLEKEAERRAFAGSDTLLIFLLKARDREKYSDKWYGDLNTRGSLELHSQYDPVERAARVLAILNEARNAKKGNKS